MAVSKADLVLRNANVTTLDARLPRARTIYIDAGRILKASSGDIERGPVSPSAQVLDCGGRTVVPAFHDAHLHVVAYAESMLNIDLGPPCIHSIEDIVDKIREAASAIPPGEWIRGAGYNEFYLNEKRHPTRHDLDRATISHPVKLTHRSGHAHVLNTPGLAAAGITNESEEPAGGMIERDLDTGLPNGLLFGMGSYLGRVLPAVGAAELQSAVRRAGETLLALGITAAQDASPGNDMARWRQFVEWKRTGVFQPRAVLMFGFEASQELPLHDPETGLRSGAVKITLDEVRGCLNPPQHELNRMAAALQGRGLQIAIHAVEEPTIEAAIAALEYAARQWPGRSLRHRIEHCSICDDIAATRLHRLAATAVTNPAFIYYSGDRYLATVPAPQLEHLYAIKAMLKAGLRAAAGSDAPVAPPDPFKGIYAAVARRSETGHEVLLGQSISIEDALRLYTANAAWSCFREKQAGSISAGKVSDLVVLDADPFRVDAEKVKDIKVKMTIMGGRVVYGGL